MTTVYKYGINPGLCRIPLSKDAEILHVDSQGRLAFIWVKINTEDQVHVRSFLTVGTGHEIDNWYAPNELKFIGTWKMGELVFHTFEVYPKE